MHTCANQTGGNISHLEQIVNSFLPYSQQQLGFDKPVKIVFQSDPSNADVLLGKTAHYNPEQFEVYLYTDKRHPKDVMRSLSHELVHHAQNCRGDFGSCNDTSPGYAQRDPHLRKMEREAYTKGNLIFRDFEDLIKRGKITIDINFKDSGEPQMSLKEWKDNELNTLLMKKWGLFQETKNPVKAPLNEDSEEKESEDYGKDESADKYEEDRLERHLNAIEHHLKALRDDMEFDEKHIDESTDVEAESPEEAKIKADKEKAIASGEDPVVAAVAARRGQVHDVAPAAEKEKLRRGPRARRPRRTGPGMGLGVRFEGSDKKMISVTEATKLTRKIIERYLKEGK